MAEWLCCSEKKCLPNHKCCGLGFYSPCYILFLTCKSPKSQKSLRSPCRVPTETLISPSGTVRGLLGESPLYGDYIGSPSGLLGDSLGTGRTSAILGLICKDSLGTPQRLLEDSLGPPGTPWGLPGTPWDSLGTPQ